MVCSPKDWNRDVSTLIRAFGAGVGFGFFGLLSGVLLPSILKSIVLAKLKQFLSSFFDSISFFNLKLVLKPFYLI